MMNKFHLYRAMAVLLVFLIAGNDAQAEQNTYNASKVLADFKQKNVAEGWKTVNDNVMGGRSKGGPQFNNGILTFSGSTNTNGGGFSSIRTKAGQYDLSGMSGLLLRVKGDGRTYKSELRTNVTIGSWNVPFRADFKTLKGEWQEVFLPFKSFTPTMFGQRLNNPPALDPSKVSAIGFMIYDKNDGPFMLQVDWVKAVNQKTTNVSKSQSVTIVDQALKDGRFKTLANALTRAELVSVLQGKGPFTVFAPTDKAFAKLPTATLENLLKPENRKQLQAVLKYHVTAGTTSLATALNSGKAKTLQGDSLGIVFNQGRVRVNNATILNADIKCSNGIIHVIDTVLLPPQPDNDIISTAKSTGAFGTLLAAVKAAGLEEALAAKGPYTIFAPTDEAFNALPKGTVENLLKKENLDQLKNILAYHVVPGRISAGDALNAKNTQSVNGKTIQFQIDSGLLKVNSAIITKTDIQCGNGVIHVIDSVLLPPENKNVVTKSNSQAKMSPAQIIENAIERGVVIFNNGNHGKCADIYEKCLIDLSENESIDINTRAILTKVIAKAQNNTSNIQRAWIYRSALDHTYNSIPK